MNSPPSSGGGGGNSSCNRYWPTSGKLVYLSKNDVSGVANGTASGTTNVWVMNGDGTGATALTQNTVAGYDSNPPRISADGSKVTYFGFNDITGANNGTAPAIQNIWTVNANGTGKVAVTQNTSTADSQFPDLNPDGSRVAFQSTQSLVSTLWDQPANNCLNVFIANSNGTGLTPLTQNTVAGLNSFAPKFSPDGSKLTFHSLTNLGGGWDGASSNSRNIWIMNANGTGRVALTQNSIAGRDSRLPTFSPGGGWISFYSNMDVTGAWNGAAASSMNVWVVRPDGTGLRSITKNTGAGLDALPGHVSYDDQKIVFYSTMSLTGVWNAAAAGSSNVWISNIDGTGLTPLTQNSAAGLDSLAGVFSNDGTKIYFYSKMPLAGGWNGTPTGSYNLFSMNVDGSNLQALTFNTGANYDGSTGNFSQPSACR